MFWLRASRLRRHARAYARLGVPIAPPDSIDSSDGVTTNVARVKEWWPSGRPVPDIATRAGTDVEVVETEARIAAGVVRMFDAVRVSAYPAVMRIDAERWAFIAGPPAENAEFPDLRGMDVTRLPAGSVVLLPPSGGRSWRSPWQRRLAGDVMTLDVLLGLVTTAHDALVGRDS